MKKFILSVKAYPKTWFIGSILFMILTGVLVLRSGKCLGTPTAPYKIISLELAWNNQEAQSIREEWKNMKCSDGVSVTEKARQNILEDLFFLIAYPLFISVCIVLVDSRGSGQRAISLLGQWAIYLATASGGLDLIENFFMYWFLEGNDLPSATFALPATIKFFFVMDTILIIIFLLIRRSAILNRIW
jgi:hypothetical protein